MAFQKRFGRPELGQNILFGHWFRLLPHGLWTAFRQLL
jgi:hypothetical protein